MSKFDEIRSNAVALMARDGFASMSLRQLARATGIQVGSLYVHYRSKDELLQDVIVEYLESMLQQWYEQRPKHEGAVALLQAFVRLYVDFYLSRTQESLIVAFDQRCLQGEYRLQVGALKRELEAALEGILRAGMSQRLFHLDNPPTVVTAIFSMLAGICHWHCENGCQADRMLVGHCCGLVLQLVGLRKNCDVGSFSAPGSSLF